MTGFRTLTVEQPSDGVTVVRLNRPERLNAINEAMLGELTQLCVDLTLDRDVRAVVLTGTGRGFCSGIDLRDFGPSRLDATAPAIDRLHFQETMASLPQAIRALPQPVIAAVNGPAVGGGLALCLAADLRICAASASFGNAAIAIGLSGAEMGMSYLLPRIVGSSLAADWMLTGRTVSADEAYQRGLVSELTDDERLLERAVDLAAQIAANSPLGVQMTKRTLQVNTDAPDLAAAIELENRNQVITHATEEAAAARGTVGEGKAGVSTTRVVQWATGAVGLPQLREVVDRPDLELVGLFVYDLAKVGVDAGDLVGRPPTGIAATNDKAAILGLDADIVLHAASKAFPENTNTDDIVALLASGTSVITTTSYNHLPTFSADADARIREACEQAGTRFHAAGEHPGFMFERLATSLTALSQRVDTITVQEFVDCSGVSGREMLVDLMGMGKRPEDITIESPMFRAVSVQYEQAIGAAAEVLGLELDEIRHSVETGTSPHDVEVACGTLAAGTVVGQIMSWTGYRDGAPVLVAQEYWTVTDDIPGWDLELDETFLVRVIVEGAPSLRLDLTIGNDAVGELQGTSGGQLAVAMTAVRAIPDVLRAPPGVVIPAVFGAYQWPEAEADV